MKHDVNKKTIHSNDGGRFRKPRWRRSLAFSAAILIGLPTVSSQADEPPSNQRDQFEVHVRPLLVKHCIECHGDARQEGGLVLTSIDALLKGGDSGPAVVPGKPDESLIVEALRYESVEMPPSGQLPDTVADGIADWIAAGSAWPQGVVLTPAPKITGEDRDWWCYKPVKEPAIPAVKDNGWCRNVIDRFIFDRLDRDGIRPSPQASSSILARRVHYAVTGLPPEADTSTTGRAGGDWYEDLVDRLLQDPAYGEHQARGWLDLVRYADSDGYNADHARPEAYRYRDYVIRSFNDDKPYDRFVLEQLAGDE
ncbi:MAG: DUF1549 domain-containing protein, partial [Planctomycetales bacterium]|nr:DUF1549 domain-containing protein [Planctomycetales bacterium]